MNEAETGAERVGPTANADQEIGVPGTANLLIGSSSRWHSRGYLPHFDSTQAIQHVTFHLADSLPAEVIHRLEAQIQFQDPKARDVERRKRIEAWVDAGHGSCILREPAVARMVQDAILFFDAQRYRVFAWVIMPNHVHALFQPCSGWSVAKIVASWKKFTARKICDWRKENANPGTADLLIGTFSRSSPIWHREYWDRYMRNSHHYQQAIEYIHQNPAKAGLVAKAEDWPWSSAAGEGRANREIGDPRI